MSSIKPLSSAKLKQIRKLKQKKYRNQSNRFLCEGIRIFNSALEIAPSAIHDIIIGESLINTPQGNKIRESLKEKKIDLYQADNRQMRSISDEVTPPGLVFTTEKVTMSKSQLGNIKDRIILYLDRISDPGNMGTIIRSACWFGVNSIMISPECVDPWNSKAVRASAGAIFEAKIYVDIDFDTLQKQFKIRNYEFVATVISKGLSLNKWQPGPKSIIFLGQEADGLSKEIVKNADVHINVPGFGSVESLNLSVATGIILYEVTMPGRTD